MDCRRSSFLAWLCWLPGAVLLAAGCTTQTQQYINPPAQVAAEVKKEKDLPPKQPTAKSCAAAGEFFRIEANAPNCPTVQREEYRERARKAYQQALTIEPNHAAALQGLARLYVEQEDHDHAVAAYRKAIKLYPKEPSLHGELGMAHARWKEWESALAELKIAYDLEPENKQCANMLGYCLARAGRYDEALAIFKKTVGEAKAHYNLARMLQHLNMMEQCRAQLELALRADPRMTEAREMLVQLNKPQATARQ